MKHSAGICYLYENQTIDRTLEEIINFKLSGLQIIGQEPGSSEVKIRLKPCESKFIELQATNPNWRIQSSVSYGII
jgi:hypothetical protein